MTTGRPEAPRPPIWRDERFWKIAFQVITLVLVLGLFTFLISNLNRNMLAQGRIFGFAFLRNSASFSIGESVLRYTPQDPYWRALAAGLSNTLTLVVAGIFLTTVVGVAAGIASFSQNWLLHRLSRAYVGLVRNIPLLLQLFFWYFAVYSNLPNPANQIDLAEVMFLNNRGVYIPWPETAERALFGIAVLVIGAIAAVLTWRWRLRVRVETATGGKPQLIALGILALVVFGIVVFGLGWRVPTSRGEAGGVIGGLRLSREYVAALSALVFYTGAFIAEIVRAGIQSVSKGQWEAARSLGVPSGLVMQLVVFPQAMRVIIPPLNSEYMNLSKNSSLAFAIAFPEIYSVANTTFNQTGRPVEVFLVIMSSYLIICLIITLLMNQLNRAVQFKER